MEVISRLSPFLSSLMSLGAWRFFVNLARFTNAVRQPAIEKGLIGWTAFREAEVAFALKRLERAQQDGFAAALSAKREEGIKGGERLRPDAAVRHEVGIVAAVAVERGERALEKGDGNRGPHVHARVEQLSRNALAAFCNLVEGRAQPVEPLVDCRRFLARELPHRAAITLRAGDRLGDPEARRPAFVRGMVHVPALAIDESVDQLIDIDCILHPLLLCIESQRR